MEEIAITPAGNECSLPAITKVSQAHIQQRLAELFDNKDPCDIPEKELRREAKRCKHCLVFSGVHAAVQIQCNGKARVIRYEVLDRDIFDSRTNTPEGTSRTMRLLSQLHETIEVGALDRPVFTTTPPESVVDTQTLKEVAQGAYDNLFSESISQLYRDSLKTPTLPLIAIASSSPSAPINPTLPAYPPIARAAHVGGNVSLQLQIGTDGNVLDAKWLNGPLMFQAVSLEAAKKWSFPPKASGQIQNVTLTFNYNCPTMVNTSVSTTH